MSLFSQSLLCTKCTKNKYTYLQFHYQYRGNIWIFLRILIMKDTAPNSLENIKHKLLSSLEGGYEVPGHAPL